MAKTDKPQVMGAVELFGKCYELFKRNFNLFLILYALPLLFALWDSMQRYSDEEKEGRGFSNLLGNAIVGPNSGGNFQENAAGLFLLLLIPYVISVLLVEFLNVRAAQGRTPTLRELWGEFTSGWTWLKLIGLMFVTVVGLMIGLILLIIPGVILLWRWFLAPYILIDQKIGIEESLRKSWHMTKGYGWPIYSVLLFSIVLVIVSVVPVIGAIIAVILGAIYAIAPAYRYVEIKKATSS